MKTTRRAARKILLIGWDGADWEHIDPLLEEGLLPGLASLLERGSRGNLASLQPMLSPMLWNSVATGTLPDRHGIHGFTEPDPYRGGVRAASSYSRKVRALWNMLTLRGMRSNVVSWWASHPAEPILGNIVSNGFNGSRFDKERGWAIRPGTIHPDSRSGELARLRVLPEEITPEQILPFIPKAGCIDQQRDPRLKTFCELLSDCASVQAVTTKLLEDPDWDLTAVYFDSIDHFCHGFMQFHPPQMDGLKDSDFEIYREVIRGAYQFHDMMLQRQLHLAGPDTTVILCSDHGFQSGRGRPLTMPREPAGPAIWHRRYGIVVMAGPGIGKNQRIEGACLTDIAPTVLHLLGLPVGEDMDGRVLTCALENPAPVVSIESWENLPGDCGMRREEPPGPNAAVDDSAHLLKHFVALGYIDDPGADKEKATEACRVELDYNLARVYLSTNRPAEALPLLENIVRRRPWESRFWNALATCCFQEGYLRQAREITEGLYAHCKNLPATATFLLAEICRASGHPEEALLLLKEAAPDPSHESLLAIGRLYVELRDYERAERAIRSALESDPVSPLAHQALSLVYLKQHRDSDALDAATEALSLLPYLPHAQLYCGIALARLGWPREAANAFQRLLKIGAMKLTAHRWLAALFRQELNLPHMVEYHQAHARAMLAHVPKQRAKKQNNATQLLDLPAIPPIAARMEELDLERPRRHHAMPPNPTRSETKGERIIVSGLPRSGTSLMMKMLALGGVEPMTDGQRAADDDNPEGYLEWEEIKKLPTEPSLLDRPELTGKAIKVISMLLPHLPGHHHYKILFVRRTASEVLASQEKMLRRLGAQVDALPTTTQLDQHRENVLRDLQQKHHVDLLIVDYIDLVDAPQQAADTIAAFLGHAVLPHPEFMPAAVRPELYRNRSGGIAATTR